MNRFKRLLAAACAGMLTLCALPGMGSWAEDAAEECERYAELLKKIRRILWRQNIIFVSSRHRQRRRL